MLTADRLVLETLAPVPKDCKCFRLINGVLVERTVADVVPALQTNAEGLKNVLENLVKEYKKKQEEMETWKVGYYTRSVRLLFGDTPSPKQYTNRRLFVGDPSSCLFATAPFHC